MVNEQFTPSEVKNKITSTYGQEKSHYSAVESNKYIDKGNLTSRECGKLVKGMVEDYERTFFDLH